MIISASRRTDIPAFYSEWFMNRLEEGFALVPNPRNPNRLSRVEMSPDNVDCIVFWTKNPLPMLDKFPQLNKMGYRYYIQFTLTSYDKSVEANLPPKDELLNTFISMSKLMSPKQAVWRYDPVIIDGDHSIEWHIDKFSKICEKLSGHTERCIISFVDPYKNSARRYRSLMHNEMHSIASGFSKTAVECGIKLFTCAEEIDLSKYGISHSSCIDKTLIEQVTGQEITAKRDANQRTDCRCIESVDIGAYGTCTHGCAYCYAARQRETPIIEKSNRQSPVITGYPNGKEIITNRTAPSQTINQISLFKILGKLE